MSDDQRAVGHVKWFNAVKGFGFITRTDGTELFVHYSEIEVDGYRTLEEGQKVSFCPRDGARGLFATRVTAVSATDGVLPGNPSGE